MELQILDCDYILLNKRPIIRIFGKTIQGETICVFYDKFLPYFYLYGAEKKYPEIIEEIEKRYDVKIEIVERFLPIGYQPSVRVLKIIGKNPANTPEIREFVKRFGIPYEADILFKYRFMADFDLKGMGWIDVKGNFRRTNTVKCKALDAESIKPVAISKNAPLRYISVDIECLSEENRLPIPEKDKIIAIGLAFHPSFKGKDSVVLIAKTVKPERDMIACSDEKEMLKKFKEIIEDYDPDIICGHNINGFDLPFLIKRLEVLKLSRDIGRSEKNAFVRKLQYRYAPTISGRVVVDSFEILRKDPWVKFKRYDLSTIGKELLGLGKIDLGGNYVERMRDMWNGNSVKKIVTYTKRDAELALNIIVKKHLLDKFFELAKISGLLLQDSLGGQAQRHEFRLLREFDKRKFIMSCKPEKLKERMKERQVSSLKGALVLEPEIGLHDWVVVLDFLSLYPSLIRANNICTTTLLTEWNGADHITTPFGTRFVKPEVRKGILPIVVDDILSTRIAIKKQLKIETDSEKKRILNAKQLALKDLLNSLYGYTGYVRSRLYVLGIANTITSFGRETITKTRNLIEENFPVKVLYADTDSVFIKSNVHDLEKAEELGREVSKIVTERMPGLQLKFEKIYKTFLIETKKRYAGWAFERENNKWVDRIETKGIETVRRDWCDLTSETMLEVLNTVLKERDIKKASKHVRNVIDNLAKNKILLEKLTIVKGITKSLDSYEGIQPHVELAKKIMKREPSRGSMVGERLGFVIIKGNQLLSKRAEDPEYVKEKGLKIDSYYYIYNQILPPLERIFEVCGVSSSELLEGSKQKSLFDALRVKKELSPEDVVLKGFEEVVCKNCNWSFRRPPLSGNCPKCSSPLYFSAEGSIGKIVDLT